jgi:tetratricopeptide (TPR) repeat protein
MSLLHHHRRRCTPWFVLAFSAISTTALAQAPASAPGSWHSGEAVVSPAPTLEQATPAAPASNADRVTELWKRGNAAWDEGRYSDAIVDYEEVAKLSPSPGAFYNLANSYQRVGRKAEALAWFVRFKAKASHDELAKAPNLDTRIAALRNQVAVLKVNVNVVGARVLVRDAVVGTKPPDGPLEVSLNEGRATVEINSEGYQPYQKEFTLRGGSALEIEVQLNEKAPSTIVLEKTNTVYLSSKPLWSKWWFWTGAGVLLAGGVTAIAVLSTDKPTTKGDVTVVTAQPTPFRVHF